MIQTSILSRFDTFRLAVLRRSRIRDSILSRHDYQRFKIPMPDFINVAKTGDIPPGEGRTYPVEGRMIAIFFVDGEYFAIDDACPHMGASLAAGWVDDGAVTCPWHAWRFCVKDGTWLDNPKSNLKTDTYPIRIEGDDIAVAVKKQDSTPDT